MGRIIAPYGVRGWVKVRPQTEAVEGLLAYRSWWLARDDQWREHALVEGRAHGSEVVARLEGFDDRDHAGELKGFQVAVPRAQLPPAPDGQYYWADLLGLDVTNREGEELGNIAEIFATGANDVLTVRGERERLIPFIESVVVDVDLESGRLVVDWGADY